MKLSDLQKMAEALRRTGFIPRLIRLADGTIIAEPADAGLPSATQTSDWD